MRRMSSRTATTNHVVVRSGRWLSKAKQKVQFPRVPESRLRQRRAAVKINRKACDKQRSILLFTKKLPNGNNVSTSAPKLVNLNENFETELATEDEKENEPPEAKERTTQLTRVLGDNENIRKVISFEDTDSQQCTAMSNETVLADFSELGKSIIAEDSFFSSSFSPQMTSTQVEGPALSPSNCHNDYDLCVHFTQDSQGNKIFSRLSPEKR